MNRIKIEFSFVFRNEPEKALPMLEEISENERLPIVNILTSLLAEFFDRNEVENFERGDY